MNAQIEISATAPKLRAARLEDYEKIRRLVLAHSFEFPPFEDWRNLWLDNPLRSRDDIPLGWVLETSTGEIVGTMGTMHSLYRFHGEDLTSAIGRFWFVAPPYRGFALQLMGEYFSQSVDLFINNTVAPAAIASFSQLSQRIPLGNWETGSYWVTGYKGFAEKALRKRNIPFSRPLANPAGAALRLKDAVWNKRLPRSPRSHTVEALHRFDAEFDRFWSELVRQHPEKLLAYRDSRTLSWHYAIPMHRKRLWILAAFKNGRMRAYCTLTQQDHHFRLPALPKAETRGFRGMRLVDYQSIETEIDLLPALLAPALRRCARENVFMLEHLGRGVPKMRALDEAAPYRQKLENWKFFYRATDPRLDAELRDARFWDPSAYDGDASFE